MTDTQRAVEVQAAPAVTQEQFAALQEQLKALQARFPGVAPPDPPQSGHGKLVCRKCNASFPADHSNPNEGGCCGYAHAAHDFYGADPVAAKE